MIIIWKVHVLNIYLIMQVLSWGIMCHNSEINTGSNMYYLQFIESYQYAIEQASVLSGEEKSFIDSVWSLILV